MDYNAIYKSLNSRWRQLCSYYLPLKCDGSIWRYSRTHDQNDPDQGWKLHVSATILSANQVFAAVGPFLRSRGAMFKAPASLYELHKLNCGEVYGYSQIGKFITLYPRNSDEALSFAAELHRLTRELPAPAVPFEHRYGAQGCVYYRFGAFKVLELKNGDQPVYGIRDPHGNLIPDDRHATSAPAWISNPFPQLTEPTADSAPVASTLLQTTFKAFEAVAQRGRGGVYKAIDVSATPPRLCILKEGRKYGEVDWDGRDGSWRVLHEAQVLGKLQRAGVNVPCLYSSFQIEENSYVAMELIDGISLNAWLGRKKRRLPVRQVVKHAIEIARLVTRIHEAGWVWRDCKPGNIMITDRGMRAIDFEGACPIDQPDPSPWGTRFFVPPEWDAPFTGQSQVPEDLYAIGAIIHLMLTGAPPDEATSVPYKRSRRKIPKALRRIINSLLSTDPQKRPNADVVARRLQTLLNTLEKPAPCCADIKNAKRVDCESSFCVMS